MKKETKILKNVYDRYLQERIYHSTVHETSFTIKYAYNSSKQLSPFMATPLIDYMHSNDDMGN